MEFLDGPGMHVIVKDREEDVMAGNRVRFIRQMAEALVVVHQHGYIHRDVCPRNFIYLPKTKEIRLIDFGLTVPATPEFMQPGNRTGTPLYMAPEVVRRRTTDQRLDVFSFGVTAYALCCFDLPWPVNETTGLAALAHDTVAPKSLDQVRDDLDPVLCRAIMQCVVAEPEKRMPSMEQFLRTIRSLDETV
jgi:serine/threonine-protein kinase